MNDAKAQTRTVSMPKSLWDAADNRATAEGADRSSYIRRLITTDLAAAGRLPGSRRAEAHARLDELMPPGKEDAVMDLLFGGTKFTLKEDEK